MKMFETHEIKGTVQKTEVRVDGMVLITITHAFGEHGERMMWGARLGELYHSSLVKLTSYKDHIGYDKMPEAGRAVGWLVRAIRANGGRVEVIVSSRPTRTEEFIKFEEVG